MCRRGIDEGGNDFLPAADVIEDVVQNGHEGDAVDGAGTLASTVGADELGALSVARNDDGLDDFADEVRLDFGDLARVGVGVLQNCMDDWSPVVNCIGGGDEGKPAAKVAEARGLNYARLAYLRCEMGDGCLDAGGEKGGTRLTAAATFDRWVGVSAY